MENSTHYGEMLT